MLYFCAANKVTLDEFSLIQKRAKFCKHLKSRSLQSPTEELNVYQG